MKNMKKRLLKIILIVIGFLFMGGLLTFLFVPEVQEIVQVIKLNSGETTQFNVVGTEVYMSGLINSNSYDQFVKLLEENPQIKTIVEINIDGSVDDDTMIKLSYYIREKGLNTKLLSFSNINSGGVDLFLAGVNRTMERGAHIGVHSWSDGFKEAKQFPKDAPEHEQNRKYIEVMLGEDDFYWFTIYAAPAKGIHRMSEDEINKYKILTSPIITKNLTNPEIITGAINSNIGQFLVGNLTADTIIINSQGGPVLTFSPKPDIDFLSIIGEVNLNKSAIVSIHQEQTIAPWNFNTEEISYEQAIEDDKKSVEKLSETIKYFKSIGKKVYVVGTSFGAFVVQDSIATHGNLADKYLIIVGRLNMQKEVWEEFSNGRYVGFDYDEKGNAKVIKFNAEQAGMGGSGSLSDRNMAKLAAGLGHKRYITLLKDTNLSNVIYVYGKKDQQVGSLTTEEVDFLKSKNVKILASEVGHGQTSINFIKKGMDLLFEK